MISCGIIENFSSRMQLFYTGRKEVKGFVKFFIYQGPVLDLFFSNAGHRINSHEYEKEEMNPGRLKIEVWCMHVLLQQPVAIN